MPVAAAAVSPGVRTPTRQAVRALQAGEVRWRQRASAVMYRLGDAVGLPRIAAGSRWRQARLLILCYHGVSIDDEHLWSPLYISPSLLDRRLRDLRRGGYAIIPLADAVRALYAGELPPRAVALTFDDGLHDFAVQAAPLLAAYDAPATVYVSTYHVRRQLPVFDIAVSYVLWKGAGRTVTLPDIGERLQIPSWSEHAARERLGVRLNDHARARGWSVQDKHEYLRQLAAVLHVDFDRLVAMRLLHVMSDAQLLALDHDRIDLQLHTHRHVTPVSADQLRRELDDNRDVLRAVRPLASLQHFCYPSGLHVGIDPAWLTACGILTATTGHPAIASRADGPLLLPRFVDTESNSDAKFAAWISGWGAWLSARTRPLPTVPRATLSVAATPHAMGEEARLAEDRPPLPR
ncbi:MAG: polysaccharide deacetylase family protein [Gemmatimonadaceae bacterium]|nr:polysaccharide deacetylase family protein [Gemmatimonadaceae bacterium]